MLRTSYLIQSLFCLQKNLQVLFSLSAGFSGIALALLSTALASRSLIWRGPLWPASFSSCPCRAATATCCGASEADTAVNFHNVDVWASGWNWWAFRPAVGHLRLGTVWQGYQTAPLTNLFSTQLFGFGVYQTALDQAEIFPVKSHETLHVHHTDFFSDRLSVFKGKIALCWILSAFAQTLLRTKLFLTKLPASG